MPQFRFCSHCWAENLLDATVCDRCGKELVETEQSVSYAQKLLWALHHPVPDVREMAALLLGLRRDMPAFPVLIACLEEETDIGVLCAICKALGQLGDCRAAETLTRRLGQPNALQVALALVDALAALAQTGCWEALRALKMPPPVSERVAEAIATKLKPLDRLYL
jgi:HEAT repeat protein